MKVAVAAVLSGLLPTLVTAWIAIGAASDALDDATRERLVAVQALNTARLEDWFDAIVTELDALSIQESTAEAIAEFEAAFAEGRDSEAYAEVQRDHDPALRSVKERSGYYDLFLISPAGDVVYTVAHEADFGSNVASGQYASTGLARAFRSAMDGTTIVTDYEPYAPSNNDPAAFIAAPVREGGRTIGVVALQLPIDKMNEVLREASGLGKTGQALLVGADYKLRNDLRLAAEPTLLRQKAQTDATRRALSGETGVIVGESYTGAEVISAYGPVDLKGLEWGLVVEIEAAEALGAVAETRNHVAIATAIALTLVVSLVVMAIRALIAPLYETSASATALAAGDFSHEITVHRDDEIGATAKAVGAVQGTLKQVFADVVSLVDRAQGGDLSGRVSADRFHGEFGKLSGGLNQLIDAVSAPLRQVSVNAQAVSMAAEEIRRTSRTIAQGSSEQAASLEQTAASMEEISGMTQQTAANTRKARDLTGRALDSAQRGDTVVQEMVRSMGDIRVSANNTAEIIKNINQIAFQTNLLALNAAVEAARAGEAGRGFAVVAEEVRNLAMRSKEAAQRTEELIQQSVGLAENGEQLSVRVKSQLSEIVGSVQEVTRIMSEISAASDEQARGVEEVTRAVTAMDQVVQNAAASAEQASGAAGELAERSREMHALVRRFKLRGGDMGHAAAPVAMSAPAAPPALAGPVRHTSGGANLRLASAGGSAIDELFPGEDDAAFEGF